MIDILLKFIHIYIKYFRNSWQIATWDRLTSASKCIFKRCDIFVRVYFFVFSCNDNHDSYLSPNMFSYKLYITISVFYCILICEAIGWHPYSTCSHGARPPARVYLRHANSGGTQTPPRIISRWSGRAPPAFVRVGLFAVIFQTSAPSPVLCVCDCMRVTILFRLVCGRACACVCACVRVRVHTPKLPP